MQVSYHTKDTNAYQKVMIEIDSSPEHIFTYLGTTKGIKQWFPELSFKGTERLIFDLGNEEIEEMEILRYQNPDFIHFTWDEGEVEILLDGDENKTQLVLNERLPFSFETIPQDFSGWQFQVRSIKHIAEHGVPKELDKQKFEAVQKEIEKNLKL